MSLPERDESAPVRLARAAIEMFVIEGERLDCFDAFDELTSQRSAAFVSLHGPMGDLCGCIGTLEPQHLHLAEEIAENAVKAATSDPRFPAIRPDQLDDLDVKVDVLHEPEEVDSLEALDPRRYGVIVTSGWKRGVLLPDLEGVDTVEQQVSIAMRKAGIHSGETVALERFRVERYK